jgi:predicted Ser/Thr protein kinase
MSRVVLLENTWNFSPERQEKVVAFLEKGWGRVIYTGAYATIIIAIIVKYGNKLFA